MKIVVPFSEIKIKASLSKGPGGQNVNKTMSACQIWWHPESSLALTESQKALIVSKAPLTALGEITIRSDESRDFERNKSNCIKKLHSKISEWLFVPKKRYKTHVSGAVKRRRAVAKKEHSAVKSNRRKVSLDDEN